MVFGSVSFFIQSKTRALFARSQALVWCFVAFNSLVLSWHIHVYVSLQTALSTTIGQKYYRVSLHAHVLCRMFVTPPLPGK